MTNRARSLSRRRILQSLGLGAAAAPLLPLMNASGQELDPSRPKRLLLLFSPDGIAARDWNTAAAWRPSGSETDFYFHYVHEPLTPMKHKIVVPWGLTLSAAGAGEAHAHGMAGLWTGTTLNGPSANATFDGGNGHLTGWGSGPSVDQLIADASGPGMPYSQPKDAPTQETAYRTVELGAQPGDPTTPCVKPSDASIPTCATCAMAHGPIISLWSQTASVRRWKSSRATSYCSPKVSRASISSKRE